MDFMEINENSQVHPGEYLLYSPSSQIVVCGAFNRSEDYIRAFGNGRYIEDKIGSFKKIQVSAAERQKVRKTKKCGGCKG
jgi:hypothetical protein|tara:strand:+ start:276 stop:515 length:240 start_codon:yes stop_codon:yes gene_type:complete